MQIMQSWIVFTMSLLWIGIGSAACIYSNESKITRFTGIVVLILGIEALAFV